MSNSKYLLADDDDYSRALDELIGAEGVLIYCGAGLSYPLTGLTWNRLILDMFENLRFELKQNLLEFDESTGVYEKMKERLSESSGTPRENATVVATYIESLAKTSYGRLNYYDKLADLIGKSIYRRLSRQGPLTESEARRHVENLLFEHVTSLVVRLLLRGTKVRVVTTNYDTYLEETLRFVTNILSNDRANKYSVKVYGSERCPNFSKLNSTTVPIVYLHGRIARNLKSENSDSNCKNTPFSQLVFSEKEYYRRQRATAKVMATVAKGMDCTLIVGSSLNDPPLLEWLHYNSTVGTPPETSSENTKTQNGNGKRGTSILVVQAVEQDNYASEALTDEDRTSIMQMTRTRYKTLGVNYFIPVRCFADLSYLIRDAIIGMSSSAGSISGLSVTHHELTTWATNASASLDDGARIRKIHDQLFENVEIVQNLISELILNRFVEIRHKFPLIVRLEYWVRGVSPHRGDPEYLVKVADSAGVFLDHRIRRSESFFRRCPSRSAALRSIQFDASELTTLNKLGQHDHASRWQAFYAAPVRSLVGNSELYLPVTTGALVAAIQLEESKHRFISRKMRMEFAEIVAKAAKRLESGDMNDIERNAFVRLDKCFRNIAIRVRNNYDDR